MLSTGKKIRALRYKKNKTEKSNKHVTERMIQSRLIVHQ
jgi:hypothetical protein